MSLSVHMATAASAQVAIQVHPGSAGASISPLIYGVGLEWTDNGNRLVDPTTGALRQDALTLLARLNIPVWRFPGGILSDYYNWHDGVGPQSLRPPRPNPMDGSMNANTFGTDELIKLCKTLKSNVLITANYGTGKLSDALAWQAYFTANNLPVKYWEIGNEIYLTEPTIPAMVAGNDARIYKTSTQYAADVPVWASALKAANPGAMVGAIAGTYDVSPYHTDWMQALEAVPADSLDFVAVHDAFAPMIVGDYDFVSPGTREAAYRAMYAQPMMTGADIKSISTQFATVGMKPKVAVTEHYPLFGAPATTNGLLEVLDQTQTLAGALYTATELQTFMSQGVWMANFNLVNSQWYGALLHDSGNALVATPTYYVYDLYRNHFGSRLIGVSVSNMPTFSTVALGTVPATSNVALLKVIASVDASGHKYLAVVNCDLHNAQSATISVDNVTAGAVAEVRQLQNTRANAVVGTTFTASAVSLGQALTPTTTSWKNVSGHDVYAFPPNSLTVFKW